MYPGLNQEQFEQVDFQLRNHKHKTYPVGLSVGPTTVSRTFVIREGVYRSDLMITRSVCDYFAENPDLFSKQTVLDMGTGTGMLGIVAAVLGASRVVFSDISDAAVENCRENIQQVYFSQKCDLRQGDLFENVPEKFNLIIFNHPFFPSNWLPKIPVSRSMLDAGELLQRFLVEAKEHLVEGGEILMPFLKLAGPVNDPSEQAERYGYWVETLAPLKANVGLQIGEAYLYRLTVK